MTTSSQRRRFGRYEILGRIGTGGMAEILLARLVGPAGFKRPVVIKRILPHLARMKRFRTLFLDEARTIAHLHQHNIVRVLDLVEEETELALILEYLDGESVDLLMRRLRRETGAAMEFGDAAYVLSEVCAAVAAAHDSTDQHGRKRPIVHRDISPSNIVITFSGQVKLIDFGIAVGIDRQTETEPGVIRGKYSYMSPEQLDGKQVTKASDIFSLGVVLYEMTTGRRLFRRRNPQATMQAVKAGVVIRPSEIRSEYPPELERLCLRALSPHPRDRPENALEIRQYLLEITAKHATDLDMSNSVRRLMTTLFPDRIAVKTRLMRRVASGEEITGIEEAEDDSEDLPTVMYESTPGGGAVEEISISSDISGSALAAAVFTSESLELDVDPSESLLAAPTPPLALMSDLPNPDSAAVPSNRLPTRPEVLRASFADFASPGSLGLRRWALLVLGFGLTIGLIVYGSQSLLTGAPQGRSAPRSGGEGPPGTPPRTVRLYVQTEPPGATIRYAGSLLGTSPLDIEIPVGSDGRSLEAALPGYVPHEVLITPDGTDQRINLVLAASPSLGRRAKRSSRVKRGAAAKKRRTRPTQNRKERRKRREDRPRAYKSFDQWRRPDAGK